MSFTATQPGVAKWLSVAVDGPPEPEVFVLCWDGRETFVDWFGFKPDGGRGVTHWLPYEMPPGASDMHDGRRALAIWDRDRGADETPSGGSVERSEIEPGHEVDRPNA